VRPKAGIYRPTRPDLLPSPAQNPSAPCGMAPWPVFTGPIAGAPTLPSPRVSCAAPFIIPIDIESQPRFWPMAGSCRDSPCGSGICLRLSTLFFLVPSSSWDLCCFHMAGWPDRFHRVAPLLCLALHQTSLSSPSIVQALGVARFDVDRTGHYPRPSTTANRGKRPKTRTRRRLSDAPHCLELWLSHRSGQSSQFQAVPHNHAVAIPQSVARHRGARL